MDLCPGWFVVSLFWDLRLGFTVDRWIVCMYYVVYCLSSHIHTCARFHSLVSILFYFSSFKYEWDWFDSGVECNGWIGLKDLVG